MVSIEETIQQRKSEISTFEQSLQKQSKSISKHERKLLQQERQLEKDTKPKALTLSRQVSLAKQSGIGRGRVSEVFKIIRKQKKEARAKARPQFKKAKKEIVETRKKIAKEKSRIMPFKTEIAKVEQFERGRKLALLDSPYAVFALETKEEREGYKIGRSQKKTSKSRFEFLSKKLEVKEIKELEPVELPKITKKVFLPLVKSKMVMEKPSIKTGDIVFGSPEKYGRSYAKETGATSFMIAIPMRREVEGLRVQDFKFQFEGGKMVQMKASHSAIMLEEQYLKHDKRRRDKYPIFFGDTRNIIKPNLKTPMIDLKNLMKGITF